MIPSVRIYVVTFRRPKLLERALRSVIAQTHTSWVVEVLNDDPEDTRVSEVINRLNDSRIALHHIPNRRGATANFNHAFRAVPQPYASVLEDDNWWEPTFLSSMIEALERHPQVKLACANERIWREQPDLTWQDTGATIWPTEGSERELVWDSLDKCGGALLCNSSLLFRTGEAAQWQTPAVIPVDVTEHFRERVVPHPLLLIPSPLVNYSITLTSSRSPDLKIWNVYQSMLVGSVFVLTKPSARSALARALWSRAREREPLFATTLLTTGFFIPQARELWLQAHTFEKAGAVATMLRRPRTTWAMRYAALSKRPEWNWLLQGPFAEYMAGSH